MWSKVHVSQDDYILVGVCYRGPEADDNKVNLCKIGQLNKKNEGSSCNNSSSSTHIDARCIAGARRLCMKTTHRGWSGHSSRGRTHSWLGGRCCC